MGLTNRQLEAVNCKDKFVKVSAPPGSGKTGTLTEKVKRSCGRKIVITFTRAAAKELRERAEMPKVSDDGSFVGTIHSFCYRLLAGRGHPISGRIRMSAMKRFIGELLGISPADLWGDQGSYLEEPKNAIEEFLNIYDKTVILQMTTLDGFRKFFPDTRFITTMEPNTAYALYRKFFKEKESQGWLTFADLLRLALDEMKASPEDSDFFALDEAQDLDPLQAKIVKELINHSKQSMMVADEDQSIYSWRLATLEPVLRWPGRRITLDRSFRVPKKISVITKNLIRFNQERFNKDWLPADEEGEIAWLRLPLELALERIKEQLHIGQISILARKNSTIFNVEQILREFSIPYQIIGKTGFFQSKEVKNILNWLYVLSSKRTLRSSIEKNLALTLYGIGEKRWQKYANSDSPLQTLLENNFHELSMLMKTDPSSVNLPGAVRTISVAISKRLNEDTNSYIEGVFQRYGESAFDRLKEPGVTLSTIHRFKGKEDENIMVVNCHNGEMPHKKAWDIEEERRIAYVAITRAKKRLIIHSLPDKGTGFIQEMRCRHG